MTIGKASGRLLSALQRANNALSVLAELGGAYESERAALQSAVEAARAERIVVAVVGAAKRGKSTLVNGLLGRRDDIMAPVGKFPATNVITVFAQSVAPAQSRVTVHFEDGTSRQIDEREIRSYACEEHNPNNSKHVRSIDVEGPFHALASGVLLADMPGSDNALAEQHAQTLHLFLPRADVVLFLIAADEPINASERELLRHLKSLGFRGLLPVVNKCDRIRTGDMDEAELTEGIEHNRRVLSEVGFAEERVYSVSAKDYMEGREGSGVEGLLGALQQVIERNRGDLIAERLEARTAAAIQSARDRTASEFALVQCSVKELDERRRELDRARNSMKSTRSKRDATFSRAWSSALDDLEKSIRRVRRELSAQYRELIESTKSINVSALFQNIHSDMHLAFRERIQPAIEECNERLRGAQATLIGDGLSGMSDISLDALQSTSPLRSSADQVKNSLAIAGASLPGVAVGAGALALPGLVGSLIASAAPAAVSVSLNPVTWLSAAASSVGAAGVATAQSAAVLTLGTIAMPISIAALSYAGYRSYSAWKHQRARERNELQIAVDRQLETYESTMLDEVRVVKQQSTGVSETFHTSLDAKLEAAEVEIDSLVRDRPTPERVDALRRNSEILAAATNRISAPSAAAPAAGAPLLPPPNR